MEIDTTDMEDPGNTAANLKEGIGDTENAINITTKNATGITENAINITTKNATGITKKTSVGDIITKDVKETNGIIITIMATNTEFVT
jgi:hypothetical protein